MDKVVIESPFANSLFKCSLCNDLLCSPTVINECLHRFCKFCITNYFETNNHNTCPTCQIVIINPLQTLQSDLTFQRLMYKIFPTLHHREMACKSSLLTTNESTSIQIETKINVYLEYWDISLDLFPNGAPTILSKCYLECIANTPLSSIEKFLRIKHSLSSTLKIDLFYKSFLLNTDTERLIDICHCFDITNKNLSLDIRFTISPYGYKAILKSIRQSKQPLPLQIEISAPTISSSLSSTSSIDSTLKVKICRSQSSTNDWYIPQSTPTVELPDLVNSCKNITKPKKRLSSLNKPRRRIRFIPTMVRVPPSIFDRRPTDQYEFNTFQSNETMIVNVEGNITDISSEVKQTQKTICKVPPYIPECLPIFESSSLSEKSSAISTLCDSGPLDLSLK